MRYNITGEPMPVVICDMDANESMITEKGSMVWMSPNMEMQTGAGGIGKAFGRMFSGESMFQNTYTARGGPGMIAFASSFPGAIRAVEITPDRPIVVQKSGFLASEAGVELSIFFQKKGMTGFFGGEGFILQKLSGYGTAFLEIDGSSVIVRPSGTEPKVKVYILAQGASQADCADKVARYSAWAEGLKD